VFEGGLPARPADVPALDFGAPDLALVRLVVRFLCEGARLSDEARDDLVLAVHELACNSVEHGDETGVLRAWSEADSLVLEISDKGVIDDPLVGRERVLDQAEGGRGIWMANHLCDLVQVRSSCAGTTVRLHTWT
jgi:anti-sigma regulatory factor (Ser/Thr protein kinase)